MSRGVGREAAAVAAGTQEASARWEQVFVPNYATPSLCLVRGEGAHVWDDRGGRYLDLLAGIAVNVLGHAHPEVVKAVQDQVARLGHVSNLYASDVAVDYAIALSRATAGRRVLFVNSGTEANEAAWKLVRRHAHERGEPDGVVVAFDGSFHGRTIAALGLTGQPAHREGFSPFPGGVVHVPYNDPGALEAAFEAHPVVAVFAEYVQGEGGVVPMTRDMARTLHGVTQGEDVLLVADEVQTGVARTGTFYAHEQFGHGPDVVTVAKGLGGGLPLGAMLVRPALADLLGPGSHGCTFGGNPVAVAAGDAVLRVVQRDALADRAARLGAELSKALDEGLQATGHPHPPRGMGLLQGIPLNKEAAPTVVKAAQAEGLLVGQAGKDVVRLAPPLVVGEADLFDAVPVLCDIVRSA